MRTLKSAMYVAVLLSLSTLFPIQHAAADPSAQVSSQIQALLDDEDSRTPAEQHIDSNLLLESRRHRGEHVAFLAKVATVHTGINVDSSNTVLVDIKADVTQDLLDAITADGGTIIGAYPKYTSIRARIPVADVGTIAGLSGVKFIKQAETPHVYRNIPPSQQPLNGNDFTLIPSQWATPQAVPFSVRAANIRAELPALLRQISATKKSGAAPAIVITPATGTVDTAGDTTERAALARTAFHVDGTGITIGVLSDSDDHLETSQANGNLGTVTVVPGQDGRTSTSTGEGTAMMEIIHDIAPGAALYFASGFNGEAQFATNIETLQSDGCNIIVDDVYYGDDPPFEDGTIATGVDSATSKGALYFSSAGNAGRVDNGSSSVWEGDFNFSGQLAGLNGSEQVHSFGTDVYNQGSMGQAATNPNPHEVYLFWTDPYGSSSNDYNLFVTDSAEANILYQSTNVQNGSQDPVESCNIFNGDKIFITKHSGSARRLYLSIASDGEAHLQYQTAGVTHGHNSAQNAVGVAATDASLFYPNAFDSTAQTEGFSADGPRLVYFYSDGSETNPGSGYLGSGGQLRQRPNLTASDGVQTSVSGFQPFYGTSAAAPHAAALAALLMSSDKGVAPIFVTPIMEVSALDIMAAGYDYDAGWGIADAMSMMAAVAPSNDNFAQGQTITGTSGSLTASNVGASIEPGEPSVNGGGRSIWYVWTPATSGFYNFNTSGSNFDTTLGVYLGGSVTNLTTWASNDDISAGDRQSSVSFFAQGGTTYHIAVDGYIGLDGNVDLAWSQIAPFNDNFAQAQSLGSAGSGTVYGSNELATKESGEPDNANNAGGQSVWYSWTAPETEDYNFNTFGSGYDTTLGVYTGSSVSSLTTVGGDDDADGVLQSSVSFHATQGTTYYIAVDGYYNPFSQTTFNGSITLNWLPLAVNGISFSPTSIPVGGTSTGTVTLNEDASQTSPGSFILFAENNSGLTFTSNTFIASPNRSGTVKVTALEGGVGTTSVQASYNNTSASASVTITKSNTAVAVNNVTGTINGSSINLEAYLTSATTSGDLSGRTLTFALDGTTLGSNTTNSSGRATHSYTIPSGTAEGDHTLTVSFAGDVNYNASSGTGTVDAQDTSTLATSGKSGEYGQTVGITAKLTRTRDGGLVGGRTISYTIGGSAAGTSITNSSGVATLNYVVPNTLVVGANTIAVSFAGDSDYTASTSSATLTVSKAPSTLAVAAVSGTYGQTVTLSATLTRTTDSSAISGATVSFKVGNGTAVTGTTNSSGVATVSYTIPTTLAVGSNTITASFTGNTLEGSSSGTGTLTVSQAATTLTAPNVSGIYGASVSLTATLKQTIGGALLSGKTITFEVDSKSVGTATTNGSGLATLSYTLTGTLIAGSHTLTATYAGDATTAASTANATLTVTKAGTALAFPPVTAPIGHSAHFTATLTSTVTGLGISGRTINFKVSGSSIGTATTNSEGTATVGYVIPTTTPIGITSMNCEFAGDAYYNSKTATTNLDAQQPAHLAGHAASGARGATVNLTATLTKTSDSSEITGRSITFSVAGTVVGTAKTNNTGLASFAYTIPSTLPLGANSLVANFPGDTGYGSSTSTSTLTVSQ